MEIRGYKVDFKKFTKWIPEANITVVSDSELFDRWHTKRYEEQCFRNLQEKYDCGGLSKDEYSLLEYKHYIPKTLKNI